MIEYKIYKEQYFRNTVLILYLLSFVDILLFFSEVLQDEWNGTK